MINVIPEINVLSKPCRNLLNIAPATTTGIVLNNIKLNAVFDNFTLLVNNPKIILNITFLKYINRAIKLPPCSAIFKENDTSLNDSNFDIKAMLEEELIGKNSPIPCTALNIRISI